MFHGSMNAALILVVMSTIRPQFNYAGSKGGDHPDREVGDSDWLLHVGRCLFDMDPVRLCLTTS